MKTSFQKRTSKIFITFFIGILVVSFIFTGMQSFRNSPDTLATVGDAKIKRSTFQQILRQRLELYKRLTGQKTFTDADRKRLNIDEIILDDLINSQLLIQLGVDLIGESAHDQVKDSIKSYKAFLKDKKFSLELYKLLLQRNQITPKDFEASIQDQITENTIKKMFKLYPISTQYAEDIQTFKSQILELSLVQIDKEELTAFIPVKDDEVSAFLKDKNTSIMLQNFFNTQKKSLNTERQIKIIQILLKTNGKNDAAIAKKITQISKEVHANNFKKKAQQYNENGVNGELGFIKRGQFGPIFEKEAFSLKEGEISQPIKTFLGQHIIFLEKIEPARAALFEEHKENLAKILLKKQKFKEHDLLIEELKEKIPKALADNLGEMKKMHKKYQFHYVDHITVDQFDESRGKIDLKKKEFDSLFTKKDQKQFYFESSTDLFFIQKRSIKTIKVPEQYAQLSSRYGKKFLTDLLLDLKNKTSIEIYR